MVRQPTDRGLRELRRRTMTLLCEMIRSGRPVTLSMIDDCIAWASYLDTATARAMPALPRPEMDGQR